MTGLVERDFRDAMQDSCGIFNPCDNESRELLHRILLQTDRLAPTDDMGTRELWLAVPTGRRGGAPAWFYLWTRHDDGYEVESVNFINYSSGGGFLIELNTDSLSSDRLWTANDFLERLLDSLRRIVDDICRDASLYNAFVENNLPKQYRSGRIRRSRLYECAPVLRPELTDRQSTVAAIKTQLCGRTLGTGLQRMTIRGYLGLYDAAYAAVFGGRFEKVASDDEKDLMKSYLGQVCSRYDIDSEEDYKRFVNTPFDVLQIKNTYLYVNPAADRLWYLRLDPVSHCYLDEALNILAAIFKAGLPYYVPRAGKVLSSIEEMDYVRIVQFEQTDELDGDDEGGQIVLPFLDARLDRLRNVIDGWTKESLEAVIASVEWDPIDVLPNYGNIINEGNVPEGTFNYIN